MGGTRTAHCGCGQLRVETPEAPLRVTTCHCSDCQRRTGSPFGHGAWFEKDTVTIIGVMKSWTRHIEDRAVINHFCPTCGGVVMWEATKRPGRIAVAVGMFADRNFPPPDNSIFEQEMHPWISFTDEMEHLP